MANTVLHNAKTLNKMYETLQCLKNQIKVSPEIRFPLFIVLIGMFSLQVEYNNLD